REATTQDVNLMSAVARALVEAGMVESEARPGHPQGLPLALWRRYPDALWDLMTQGAVTIGSHYSNPDLPPLSLTEYGRECVNRGEILPHDREGYLRALEDVRPLDDTEKWYIPQALAAYHHNLIDASAVMIGCASEHLVYELAEAVIKADPARA